MIAEQLLGTSLSQSPLHPPILTHLVTRMSSRERERQNKAEHGLGVVEKSVDKHCTSSLKNCGLGPREHGLSHLIAPRMSAEIKSCDVCIARHVFKRSA